MLLDANLTGAQHLGIPVTDIDTARAWYANVMGFTVLDEPQIPTPKGDIRLSFLIRDDVTIELYQLVGDAVDEIRRRRHGHIDHFALDVLDVNRALARVCEAGATLDEATASGPADLPSLWSVGVRYVFLKGPSGEKVELNQRLDLEPTRRAIDLGGWSHLGIPVTDLPRSREFYAQFGFDERMYAEVPADGDVIRISMLEKAGFMLELYQLVGNDLVEVSRRADGHIDHMAFDVLDAEVAYEELSLAGFSPLEDAPVFLPLWEHGVKYFNVRGPDGEKLEFNERIK